MYYKKLANILAKQKYDLSISEARIAAHTGLSQPTVHRILSGKHEGATWDDVVGIAHFLGIKIAIETEDADKILDRKAQKLAEAITQINLATNQLEGQGFSKEQKEKFITETKRWLLNEPKKIWLDDDGL